MKPLSRHAGIAAAVTVLLALPASLRGAGNTWYAAGPLGSDLNPCNVPNLPCNTINAAIAKAQAGDTILVTGGGIYTGFGNNDVVHVDKTLVISGGWDVTFSTRPYFTIIDGEHQRRGISVDQGADLDLSQTAVIWGRAPDGGGIYVKGGLRGDRLFVVQNRATNGGGIYFDANVGNNLILFNSALFGNEYSWRGGGLFVTGSRVIDPSSDTSNISLLFNVTLSNNISVPSFDEEHGTPPALGAGAYIDHGYLEMWHVTSAENTIWDGHNFTQNRAGIAGDDFSYAVFKNTLVADGCDSVSWFLFRTEGNNVERGNTCFFFLPQDRVNVNPLIYPPSVNPGPYTTVTHALAGNSPAVDGARPDFCTQVDQRGVARPQGVACDVGAYERSATDRAMGFITHPGGAFADAGRCPAVEWNRNGRERPNVCRVDTDVLIRAVLGGSFAPISAPAAR